MEKVKEGYKMTELGEIPEEWQVDLIDNVAKRYSGHTPDKKIDEYWNGNIPWISLKDTKRLDSGYIMQTEDYTTVEGINNSSAVLLPEGTVVLSRDATVGKVGIAAKSMATSQHFINYVCGEKLNNIYLYYDFFNRKPLFERIGVGSTIKTIGLPFFKSLKVVLPPLKEQQKIASILSSVDEQLESTDNLIAKTKELKKGLMQKLLTKGIGHERFKDTEIGRIPEEWEVVRLFDTGQYINGRAFKPVEWSDKGTPIIRIQNLTDSNADYNYYNGELEDKYCIFKGDLLFPWSGSIGLYIWNKNKAYLNQHIYKVVPNDGIEKEYLYYQLLNSIENLLELSHGSTMKHITRKNLELMRVALPNIQEQQKIASILSCVDNQIEEYKSKKQKLVELKKALMQNLLSGKVRVKI